MSGANSAFQGVTGERFQIECGESPMNFLPAIFVLAAGLLAVAGSDLAPARQIVGQFCVDCHDSGAAKGGLNLESIVQDPAPEHAETWEKVVRKVRARQMPPPGKKRPKEAEFESALRELTRELDAAAIKHPNPGLTETFRRLNRTEYRNAIRDLLALEVDTAALLPKDDASHGFDNVTVAGLSPHPA